MSDEEFEAQLRGLSLLLDDVPSPEPSFMTSPASPDIEELAGNWRRWESQEETEEVVRSLCHIIDSNWASDEAKRVAREELIRMTD